MLAGGRPKIARQASYVEDIDVVIHVMLATIDEARRNEYTVEWAWALAPVPDAATMTLSNIVAGEPNTVVEFWTRPMIERLFGKDGKVNGILRDHHHLVQLNLIGGENCRYFPGSLRPDRLIRDSIPTPQTATPWTGQFFSSINHLFSLENPHVLHVFLWWSVAEADIDDVDSVTGAQTWGGTQVWGYSRSAARGGPAVWMGAHECLMRTSADLPDVIEEGCARVIAHEVGHALGLHHVDVPSDNLMYVNQAKSKGVKLSDSQKEEIIREAREQFGPR
jgi:matrixin